MGSDAPGAGRRAVSILTDTGWLFRLMFGTELWRCWIVCLPWRLCELGEAGCREAGTLHERLTSLCKNSSQIGGVAQKSCGNEGTGIPEAVFLAHWWDERGKNCVYQVFLLGIVKQWEEAEAEYPGHTGQALLPCTWLLFAICGIAGLLSVLGEENQWQTPPRRVVWQKNSTRNDHIERKCLSFKTGECYLKRRVVSGMGNKNPANWGCWSGRAQCGDANGIPRLCASALCLWCFSTHLCL